MKQLYEIVSTLSSDGARRFSRDDVRVQANGGPKCHDRRPSALAGNETTTNLIGNGAAAFASHPDQAALLAERPELLPGAVEEVLRWDAPVQSLFRATTQPVTVAGVDLPAQAMLLVSFAAANRDGRHFPDADRFDIERQTKDHLAFGHGIHFCLGAALARLEARVLGETLMTRNLRLQATAGAQRVDSTLLRGFAKYPVLIAD